MPNKKKHLSFEERFLIEKLLGTGASVSFISNALKRGVSTITDEINYIGGRSSYNAQMAQDGAQKRQKGKKIKSGKIFKDTPLKKFVLRKNKLGMSAESISRLLRNNSHYKYASPKSIRKFIKTIYYKSSSEVHS